MKKIFLLFPLLVLGKVGMAKTVPVENATNFAKNYLTAIQSNDLSRQNMSNDVVLVQSENALFRNSAEPAYFMFNLANGKGFVIIAGDDAVKPIIGYSNENTIDPKNMPDNFKAFMENIKKQIVYVKEHHLKATEEIKNEWSLLNNTRTSRSPKVVVAPLIKSHWNQDTYYNASCPGGSYTGCVATAMAQIMRYWNYPAVGTGSHSYNSANYGTQSANFGATTYNWSSMPDIVSSSNSAVATLMYHCGVAVEMNYSTSGSGAWVTKNPWQSSSHPYCAEVALKSNFGYSSVEGKTQRLYYTPDWIAVVKGELNNGRPLLYSGNDNVHSGHAWVLDGYNDAAMFHMNWGWGGWYDGYFALGAINPNSNNFSENVEVLINIEKPNRLSLSSLSGPAAICSNQSLRYTINGPAAFSSYWVTAPVGWAINGTVSTGEPISVGSNEFFVSSTPSSTVKGGVISATGVTAYGETTRPVSITVAMGIGEELFSYQFTPGFSQNYWTASPGSTLQTSDNNIGWINRGTFYSWTVKYPRTKTIYVRATNGCGASTGMEYNLYAEPDPNGLTTQTGADEELEKTKAFVIFPNPVSDVATIKLNIEKKKPFTILVYNSLGELVYCKKETNLNEGGNSINIETSNFANGIYNVTIISNENSMSKAFVVNK